MRTFAFFLIAFSLMEIAGDLTRIADALAPKPKAEPIHLLPADSTVKKLSKQLGGP